MIQQETILKVADNSGARELLHRLLHQSQSSGGREFWGCFRAQLITEIERQVLDASAGRIEMERAWYLPMGFDQRPDEVRDLAEILEAGRH